MIGVGGSAFPAGAIAGRYGLPTIAPATMVGILLNLCFTLVPLRPRGVVPEEVVPVEEVADAPGTALRVSVQ